MKAIDPTLTRMVFTYTDTDSLHIMGEDAKKLKELGYIKSKNESTLGFLCSDIDDEGIIISENNLAPKTYFYEYVDNKDTIHVEEQGTVKAKGIPKKCLNYEMYDESNTEINRIVEFSGLRRKHTKLTKADKDNNVPFFSIVNNTQTRTFCKTSWSGMHLHENRFYPYGYNDGTIIAKNKI